jgi:uncharacterized membrane protein
VFFALILQLIVLRSLKTNRGRIWILFAVIAALSFYAYPYTAALLFAQFLFLTIHALSMNEEGGRKTARRRIGYFLASAIAAAAAYLPWQLYSFSNAQGEAPPQMGIRLVLQMIKGLGDGSYPLAATLLLFAAIGIRSLQKEKRSIALWALLSWLLAPLPMIVIVLYWRNYFFAERQLLFITPALIILAAIGADWARKQLSLKRYQPEAVIILISLAVIGLHYPDRQDDLKGAARFLKENVRPSDVIIAPNLMGVLSLYYPEIWEHAESKPSHSRIIYLDSRFNNNRQELEALIDSSKQRKEISFRGIKIIYFFEPGEKETEVAASTAETGDSELF